jgi:hypothetical protein
MKAYKGVDIQVHIFLTSATFRLAAWCPHPKVNVIKKCPAKRIHCLYFNGYYLHQEAATLQNVFVLV